jgi:hypothetical protein
VRDIVASQLIHIDLTWFMLLQASLNEALYGVSITPLL